MKEELKVDLRKISPRRNLWVTFCLEFIKPGPFKAIFFYRVAHYFHLHKWEMVAVFFETLIKWRYASDIRRGALIGKGMSLPHPYGVVIGGKSKIGENCHIGQHVTIGGNMGKEVNGRQQPTIGDNCFICANSVVVGPIEIGNNTIIGAGSVVTHSLPANVVAAGNPCKVIKHRD